MPTLVICPRAELENAVRIWPSEAMPLPLGLVQEAKTYWIELRDIPEPSSAELFIDDLLVEALRNPNGTTARWLWSPDFYSGKIRLKISFSPSRLVELDLVVDPDLAKLTRDEFDCMVRDILEDTTALFSLSGFRVGIARGIGDEVPPIARLEFLSSRIAELERVIQDISRKPVRVLSDEQAIRSLSAVRNIKPKDLYNSFYKQRLQPAPLGFRIAEKPVPAIPMQLSVSAKTASQDMAENRAIKTSLRTWRSWLLAIGDQLSNTTGLFDSAEHRVRQLWSRRCRTLARRLSLLLDSQFFEQISNGPVQLKISPIFRRVPQYLRFLGLYRDINLGIAQIQGDFLNLPLSRTFDLYELWVFLRLCRAAVKEYGLDIALSDFFIRDATRLGIARLVESPTLAIQSGVKLKFKRNYREFWVDPDGIGSFSRTMIPDISLERNEPNLLIIVLDAKYRIGRQLNEAISSIHMYRDAIVEEEETNIKKAVVAAYLVTPHLDAAEGEWRALDMPSRLFHPEYRATFRFGAVTLRPGQPLADAIEALRLILVDALEASA